MACKRLHLAFLSENWNTLPLIRLKEGLVHIVYVHKQILGLNAHNACANLGLDAYSLGYYAVLVNMRKGVEIFVFFQNLWIYK